MVGIECIGLSTINRKASQAVDRLIYAAKKADCGLDDFYEDQFVMEIGSTFILSRETRKVFIYFKFPYPSKKRTDVLLEGAYPDGGNHCIWIEVKFRKKLCENEWLADLRKLRSPRKGNYHAIHHGYWVYLYVFKPSKKSVERFGEEQNWKRRKTMKMVEFFKLDDPRRKTGQMLENIDNTFGRHNTICSIIPFRTVSGDSSVFFGLLITAQAK